MSKTMRCPSASDINPISPNIIVMTRQELDERISDAYSAGVLRGKFEALSKTSKLKEHLRMLIGFAQNAPRLDFKEDITLSWISVVTADAQKLLAPEEGIEP